MSSGAHVMRAATAKRSANSAGELPEPRGARVITPPLGRPFEPDRIDQPHAWWRAVSGRQDANQDASDAVASRGLGPAA